MTRRIYVFVLLALLVVGGTSLLANPPHESFWEYYTDSTYTELCGEKYVACTFIDRWGCQTAYYYVWDGEDC